MPDRKDFNMGREGVVIGGDNIEFSKNRRDAWVAYREGRASPAQTALLSETDNVMRQVLKTTGGDNNG
jgi:hypothetical protein